MEAMAVQQPLLQGQRSDYFDDSSRYSMSSSSRRLSRGSSAHRGGNSMRVAKPSSASNSPQAPWTNRRRTMMQDATTSRRTQQVLEQLLSPENLDQNQQANGRTARPVSWHPGSYLQQQHMSGNFNLQPQQVQQQGFPIQAYFSDHQHTSPHFAHMSPGMIACSANTSPVSNFSPLPMQYAGFSTHNSQYIPSEAWQHIQKSTQLYPTPSEHSDFTHSFPVLGGEARVCPQAPEATEWQNYLMQGMSTTTPPTPESLMQPEPVLPALPQDSPAFQTLDEPEDDGEVLVGMGLYDTPEKLNEDPHLDNYRSTVYSLLGSRFRPVEPQGKGLKLEETWAPPPKSDNGEEEDDDEEGEDEEPKASSKTTA